LWYNIPMNASQNFKLKKEFITLGQLVKACGFIASGGDAKTYLLNTPAKLNGEYKTTRKTKVVVGDVVEIENNTIYITND
jgi:ribosome-associated protein